MKNKIKTIIKWLKDNLKISAKTKTIGGNKIKGIKITKEF